LILIPAGIYTLTVSADERSFTGDLICKDDSR
jgi:hypothetical protein